MMYLLDTNVVSELRKSHTAKGPARINAYVWRWSKQVAPDALFLSAISVLELEIGVLQIARRDPQQGAVLRSWINDYVLQAFAGRILQVDANIALRAAAFHVPNPSPFRDSLIASTALVHGMTMVTRNIRDFSSTGVAVLNPWEP
jgi:predicted nucleic acid-binding protein